MERARLARHRPGAAAILISTVVPSLSGVGSAKATFTARTRVSVGRPGSCGLRWRSVTDSGISSTRLVEVVGGDDPLPREVLAAAQGEIGQPRLRLRLHHLGLGLAEGGAKGIALQLGHEIALAYDLALVDEQAHDASGALRAHHD